MRTLLFTGTLLFTVYIFNSCSICSCKKISCPAFEDVNFQTWFAAYQSGQQSIFKYQSSYDTITLGNPHKSEAYEGNQGCYGGDQGCSKEFSVGSNEVTNFRYKLSITYSSSSFLGSLESPKNISLWLLGFNCAASDVNEQGLVLLPGSYTGSYAASLNINGTAYNHVQTITRDTTISLSAPAPYKVYLSKGTGVVAYEMFPSHELWIKQ